MAWTLLVCSNINKNCPLWGAERNDMQSSLLPWIIKNFCFYILGILQYERCYMCPSPSCFTDGFYVLVSSQFFILGAYFCSCLWLVHPFVLYSYGSFTNCYVKGLPPLKILFMFPNCPHSSSLTYMCIIYANRESPLFRALSPSFCCPS